MTIPIAICATPTSDDVTICASQTQPGRPWLIFQRASGDRYARVLATYHAPGMTEAQALDRYRRETAEARRAMATE